MSLAQQMRISAQVEASMALGRERRRQRDALAAGRAVLDAYGISDAQDLGRAHSALKEALAELLGAFEGGHR